VAEARRPEPRERAVGEGVDLDQQEKPHPRGIIHAGGAYTIGEAFMVLTLLFAALVQEERAKIDEPVRDFKLKDVMKDEESFVTLSQFRDKKAVVLYFVSDKCPVTWQYERRTGKLFEDFRKEEVAFLGIRSSAADSAEQIRKYCESRNFEIPVLYDDRNVVADYFRVRVTPIYCVIDKKGILRYQGGFDDLQTSRKFRDREENAKTFYVRDALRAVLDGKDVVTKEFAGYG
jgi:peroxiredoxin